MVGNGAETGERIEVEKQSGHGAGGAQMRARRRLRKLDVHFVSLVGAAANRRAFLVKEAKGGMAVVEKALRVVKTDGSRRMVYGVVYAPGEVDTEGDTMEAADIEAAAYAFMKAGRTGQVDADHDSEAGKGFVAESWIVRAGDPLLKDEPDGAWAVGIKVTDEATWGRVEKGELRGLSMAGLAVPEVLDAEKGGEGEWGKEGERERENEGEGIARAESGATGVLEKIRKLLGLSEERSDAAEPEIVGQEQVEPAVQPEDGTDVEKALRRRVRKLKRTIQEREARIAELEQEATEARERVAELEKQTGGRQTQLGVEGNVVKEESFRGVRIL